MMKTNGMLNFFFAKRWYVELIFYFCPYFINVVVKLNVLVEKGVCLSVVVANSISKV